ncbi:MAG: tetratricopeptide repeat protein [Tannerellaceae bacterium]|jgi:tetratricopeptide (TPR) repeat protein|nr:tetratricopeptide repeat protein [Tannerellaceae bacterium]
MDNQKKDFLISYARSDEGWAKPVRNLRFTGRKELLETVRQRFEEGKYVALIGYGGVGKSQVAMEYAFLYGFAYKVVWWVNAETADAVLSSFEAFVRTYKLLDANEYTSEKILSTVRNWMNRQDDWLFIFENVSNEASLSEYLPQDTGRGRHVLVTSRHGNWGSIATPVSVDVFTKEEAGEFLTRRTGIPCDEFQESLAEELGRLPLALEQAAAYICNNAGCDYRNYLPLLKKYRLEVFKASPDIHAKQSVRATWGISIQKIASESAVPLLSLCAFFVPDRINLIWLMLGAIHLPRALRETLLDMQQFSRTGEALIRYSLVNIRGVSLSLHRLLQEVMRDRLKEEKLRWLNFCVLVLTECRCSDLSTTESRSLFPELASQIHFVMAQIPLKVQGEEHARLYFFLGKGYDEFGDYSKSMECYVKALDIRERILGVFHYDTAITYHNIAEVYEDQGDYDQAMECYLKALTVYEKVLGTDHPYTAITYNNIAVVHHYREEYDQALEYHLKAIAIKEKTLGAGHPDTAATCNSIATVYRRKGDHVQALEWYRKTLKIQEKALGAYHPEIAAICNDIALIYTNQKSYTQALEWHQKARAIREKVLGTLHSDTAVTYNNIAGVYNEQGNYAQALEWFMKSLSVSEKILGASHYHTATTYNNIATVYCAQGKYAKALEWFIKALPAWTRELGSAHPHTKSLFNNIKLIYQATRNPQPFEEWLKAHGGSAQF